MKKISINMVCVSFLALAVLETGCRTTVNLSVMNASTLAQQVQVSVKTPSGNQESQIELGSIGIGKTQSTTFSIKHGGQFSLNSSIPGSA